MKAGEIEISIYRNIFDKTSRHTITIDRALDRIKSGKSAKAIIDLRNEADENRQSMLKEQLVSVLWSGLFDTRTDAGLITHSGFICLDFDHINVTETKEKLSKWAHTYACWISPRGNGVKALVRIAEPKKHLEHFLALRDIFPEIDAKCGNISRVCYESFDAEIYINESAKVFSKVKVKEQVTERTVNTDTYEIFKKIQKWLEKKGEAFTSGNRNEYVFKLASALCRFGVTETEATNLLQSEFTETTFKHVEIERTVRSAYKKNQDKYGSAEFSNETVVERSTTIQIDPAILLDGATLKDVIYGVDAYQDALDIFQHGYKSAETTYVNKLDEFFKFKRGELTLLTGIGNHGKTTYLNQLFLIKSYFDNTKWATFSPENFPAAEYYFDLTEMLIGTACNEGAGNKPPQEYFDRAYKFVSEHFYYVYPDKLAPTPTYIKTKFMELILKEKIDGVLIDPFNQLTNDYNSAHGRDDKYLETFLSDCKRFAQENNIYFFIIAHPHKLQKQANGNYPCPDVYELAGGAMWNNKCDNILTYHRPFGVTDPENPLCEHHSKKIRRQKMIGKKGFFEFELNKKKRRFLFDGKNPLSGNSFEYNFGQPEFVADDSTPF